MLRSLVADAKGTPYDFDGVFLDNANDFNPHGSSNAHCDKNAAVSAVHIQTGKLFQKYKKWPMFSSTGGAPDPATMWKAGVGYTKFYEYFVNSLSSMQELYADTQMGLPTTVHAPTAVRRHGSVSLNGALAAFLVAAGDATHSYFQYSAANWVVDASWKWSALYDTEYGAPLGPPKITTYGPNGTGQVWERRFKNGYTARVNCTPPDDRQFFCPGDVTKD